MNAPLRQWLAGVQHSYILLRKVNMRGNYSVCSELVLIMMGAGVAASALPQRRVGDPALKEAGGRKLCYLEPRSAFNMR